MHTVSLNAETLRAARSSVGACKCGATAFTVTKRDGQFTEECDACVKSNDATEAKKMKPLKLTLKGMKVAAFASEETTCFSATLCIDGKPAFEVSNDGHGGADMHRPLKGQNFGHVDAALKRIAVYAATLPPLPPMKGAESLGTFPQDVETLVSDLITREQYRKDMKRALTNGILYTSKTKPGVFEVRIKGRKAIDFPTDTWTKILARTDIAHVLNRMPEEDALTLWIASVGA